MPTVRSRRLAAELRRLRRAAGLTPAAAAAEADVSTAMVYRSEEPGCRPKPNNVRALVQAYGVTDPAVIRHLVGLAKDASRPGWWHDYGLPAALATFIALEAEASAHFAWEPALIPGLLQIRPYARVIFASAPGLSPGQVEDLVRVRAERQKVLVREDPLRLHVIMDETAVRRVIGTRALMREQLAHLLDAAAWENVTLQVLPADAPVVPPGPFSVLRYPDEAGDHHVVFCDTLNGPVYAEETHDADRAHWTFGNLADAALPPGATIDLVARVAADL